MGESCAGRRRLRNCCSPAESVWRLSLGSRRKPLELRSCAAFASVALKSSVVFARATERARRPRNPKQPRASPSSNPKPGKRGAFWVEIDNYIVFLQQKIFPHTRAPAWLNHVAHASTRGGGASDSRRSAAGQKQHDARAWGLELGRVAQLGMAVAAGERKWQRLKVEILPAACWNWIPLGVGRARAAPFYSRPRARKR